MARDLPFVGVTYSPEIAPNSDWYLVSVAKSNITIPASKGLNVPFPSLGSNITNRAYSFITRRGRQYELGRIEAGEAQLQVDNSDGLFDPNNASSSYYPNILPYKPININCAYPVTGNILNDSNLAAPIAATAPASTDNYRVSLGANDGNFDLGVISNWYSYSSSSALSASSTYSVSGTYSMNVTFSSSGGACLDVPVIPGQPVTISLYYRGGSNSLKINENQYAVNLSALTLNSPSSFTRYQVTRTPKTSKITIQISGTSSNFYVDNVQVEFGSSATTYITTGPKIYNLFRGFVERYPQTYQAPNRGQANMVATDSVSSLSNVTLTNPYESLILQDANNIYYYPFSEPSTSLLAYNAGLYNQSPMQVLPAPVSYVSFGELTTQSGIPGAGTTGVTISPTNFSGTGLQVSTIADISFDSSHPTYTFSFWIKLQSTGLSGLIFRTNLNNGQNGMAINLGLSSGNFSATIANASATPTGNVASVAGWNFVSLKMQWSGTAYTYVLYVTNATYGAITSTAGSLTTTKNLAINDMTFNNNITDAFNNLITLAHFSVNRGSISVSSYYNLGAYALSGQSTGTRFSDVISKYSGFKNLPYATNYGKDFMQSSTFSGKSMFDALQNIADTEGGTWYVDSNGYTTFKDRWNRLQKIVPSVTFGDGSGETPYEGGELVINYDPTYVINQVDIQRLNGANLPAQDQSSVANYFPRSYSRTIENQSDSTAADAAYFLLSRYKDPHARPEQIKLTPARNPSVWPVALNLEIGDLVRVNKRPLGATAISIDCFIERIEHSFDAQTADWITTVTLSPAIVYYWNLAAMRATTTGSAISGSYVFTKSATTGAGLNSARDIRPGQLLQYTASGTTYVDVVSGVPTETLTTVTVPATNVGSFTNSNNTIKSTTLSANIPVDALSSFALSNSFLNGTSGTYLIDEELVTGSVSSNTLVITARAQNSTLQTIQGSGLNIASPATYSHFSGATIYYVTATAGGNVPTGTLVTELLPNQLSQYPYSVPTYTNYDFTAILKSWTGTINLGSFPTTVSGLTYNTLYFYALVDKDNYPASDISAGQMFSIGNESFASVNTSAPATTDQSWTMNAYKITDSGTVLNANITPDTTTLNITGTPPATNTPILIGSEFMIVTGGSSGAWTVTRGTPQLVTWGILLTSPHYIYDKVYTIALSGLTGTYTNGQLVYEGYNVTTPVVGSARLGY